MTDTITLRGPGDVVAALPYQLGYHPRRSVAVVALAGKRVGLVARVDLPPDPLITEEVVGSLLAPFRREEVGRVLLVGYEDDPDESIPLLMALVEALETDRVEVVDVSVVRDGRRYSPVCSLSCCPPGGVPVPGPEEVPAVAAFVALGSAPLAGREDVERRVAADPSLPTVPPRARLGDERDRRRAAVLAWSAVLGPGPRSAATDPSRAWVGRVATAAAGLSDIALRDALCAWLAPAFLEREALDPVVLGLLDRRMPRWAAMGCWPPREPEPGERAALVDVLTRACRAVPDDRPTDAAALCTVAAHAAWADGDGALARAALDRALRLVPDYRLAVLLERLVGQGVRPRTRPALREQAG